MSCRLIPFQPTMQGDCQDSQRSYIGNLPVPLCTVGEFAFVTGVSDQTIRRCIHAGELPATRVGHRLFIRTDKFLEEEAANGR